VASHEPGEPGVAAVLRQVHTAGSQARLFLETVHTKETVEAEISRTELAGLGLKLNDFVLLRLRPVHSFQHDYTI